MSVAKRDEFFAALSDGETAALPYLFEFWAHDHQLPPDGDWRTWVILGGRGAGKTRAGAEWLRSVVEGVTPMAAGRMKRLALVGETYDQTRDVMVFGDSGILAVSPKAHRPQWHASRRMLEWPNGATAQLYSAQDPEALRGPQFDGAWSDELGKWRKADEAWDMLQFALRLGQHPQQLVTTTPRSTPALRRLMEAPSTVQTHAKTEANRAYLAHGFIEEMRARFSGTRLGKQELDGAFIDDVDGALWTQEMIEKTHKAAPKEFDRLVVAVDPPASSHKRSDACGIIVAGLVKGETDRAYVLGDHTLPVASPTLWSQKVVELYEFYGADRVVIETNQGGDMVESILRQVDAHLPITRRHARLGKTTRAEPVAALYEQGRVFHAADLNTLEDQMAQMSIHGYQGKGSPDRVDALVWAIHELMLAERRAAPRMRTL